MYAYKYNELKPEGASFVRPMSYPESFWPDTPEAATILANAKTFLKSVGVVKQFYKITGNLIECLTVFDTNENAAAMLEISNTNFTRLKSAPFDQIPESEWTSDNPGYQNFLLYSKLRFATQASLSTEYTFAHNNEIVELTESDLEGYTENTSW
jgi:hypothetical protein